MTTCPIRPSRCRTCRARRASLTPTRWRRWLVSDQRAVADRTDVLTYMTPPLTDAVRLSGAPVVHLVRLDERHRQRLGREADRRLSRTRCRASRRWAATSCRSPWTSSAAAIARASSTRSAITPASRCPTPSRCRRSITSSSRDTASWCRCSRRGSRSTTAIRRRSCRTSSSRSRPTTSRRRSASTTRPARQARHRSADRGGNACDYALKPPSEGRRRSRSVRGVTPANCWKSLVKCA